MYTPSWRSERGSAIIVALGFMVLVLIIGAGVHDLVVGQLRGSGTLRERTAADYLAQGGIARAVGWFTNTSYQLPPATQLSGAVPVLLGKGGKPVRLPSNHPDSYTDGFGTMRKGVVQSFNTYLTAQKAPVGTYNVTASLVATQPETWEVFVAAEVGTTARQARALLVRKQDALFSGALFGKKSATLNGTGYTDSYDASLGAYGGSNVGKKGDVGSDGAVTVKGSTIVNGNAIPGPGQTVSIAGKGVVTGSTSEAASLKSLPVPAVPGGAVDLGAISLSGTTTKTLTAGTYKVSALTITSKAQLKVDPSAGPVTLYVTGKITIAGNGIANLSGNPSLLSIVQVGGSTVSVSGNGTLYATIYAPSSSVTVSGNNVLYGGFIGNTVSVSGGATVHYDMNLRTTTTIPTALRVMSQWSASS